ncbi:MAG: 50S ribosomal protein L1 [Gammaproteobacteria bacterium]|nr:50S ribosomal protein L1 [Gammaproteobacteria bacterium]
MSKPKPVKAIKPIKRQREVVEKVTPGRVYPVIEALNLVKLAANAKFDETIDVAFKLGIDTKKTDQVVRGSTMLPSGTGKKVRVAVFAQGAQAEAAKNAGAEIVGFEDLAEKIKAGEMNFDVLIATPDAMRLIGPLGAMLGPRGLMPNPKVGTVSPNAAQAVTNAKGGQVTYRADKNGIVHCSIGKASFTSEQLHKNLEALVADLKKARPASAKGVFFKKITLSSTMGPGIQIDAGTIAA